MFLLLNLQYKLYTLMLELRENNKKTEHQIFFKTLDTLISYNIGDPYGNRTHDLALRGPRLNRLTNGPYSFLCYFIFITYFAQNSQGLHTHFLNFH